MQELCLVSGIGPRKALAVQSALALACRMTREIYAETPLLDTPEAVANLLREESRSNPVETFYVVLLNTRHRLIRVERVSSGTLDRILVTAREIFARGH